MVSLTKVDSFMKFSVARLIRALRRLTAESSVKPYSAAVRNLRLPVRGADGLHPRLVGDVPELLGILGGWSGR